MANTKNEVAAALQAAATARDYETLVALTETPGAKALFADKSEGQGWMNWIGKRLDELAPAPPPPPDEEPAPPPPAEPAEPAQAAIAQPAPKDEPKASAQDIGDMSLDDLIKIAETERLERTDRLQEAFESLMNALSDKYLIIPKGTEYQIPPGDRVTKAVTFLRNEIANGRMTVEEAVEFAQKQGWTIEVEVDPRICRKVEDAFDAAGYTLKSCVVIQGQRVYPATRFGRAVEAGTLSLDDVVAKAPRFWYWDKPSEPEEESFATVGEHVSVKEANRRATSRRSKSSSQGGH